MIPYNKLKDILSNTLEKHVPLNLKIKRGNQASFMSKELSRAVIESRLRKRYLKYPKNIKHKHRKTL